MLGTDSSVFYVIQLGKGQNLAIRNGGKACLRGIAMYGES